MTPACVRESLVLLGASALLVACGPDDTAALDPHQDVQRPGAGLASRPDVMASAGGQKIATLNGGADYVEECIEHGVPVPDTMLDVNNGWEIADPVIANPFMAPELVHAELWTFENRPSMNGPDGICMALPRGTNNTSADVVGVICMGWNGKTCYFTAPDDLGFNFVDAEDTADFLGGIDLIGNSEGVCSDCHAGANPFIVHPEDPAFSDPLSGALSFVSRIDPDAWPTPIVPDAYPGNPEPIESLGPVTAGELRCDTCHVGGRKFPLVSTDFPGYCEGVLRPALGEDAEIPATMPPSTNPGDYSDHAAWMLAACDLPPGGGQVIPFDVPPHIEVFPPLVEPPYACSKHVTVKQAVLDAELTLFVDGVEVASGVMRTPDDGHIFALPAALVEGQRVEATQTIGGVESDPGGAQVRDHTEDYPDGLPAPTITPTPIYECATAIAVANVPGVTLTIVKDPAGATPALSYNITTGASHTWAGGLGSPFKIDDTFKVKQTLCTDISDYSAIEAAEDAPATLPELTIDPPELIEGQELIELRSIVQGSGLGVKETTIPLQLISRKSVPYNEWVADLGPALGGGLEAGHVLVPKQQLCGVSSGDPEIPTPRPCEEGTLVPRIARPHDGDTFVLVTEGIPGGIIRVFDKNATEIGNGSGEVIGISRPLIGGETIAVVQQLPACTVDAAFSIVVAP